MNHFTQSAVLDFPRPWRAPRPATLPQGLLDRWLATWRRWREVSRSRRDLATLDDHLLKDIGITRAEAQREFEKPFWRV